MIAGHGRVLLAENSRGWKSQLYQLTTFRREKISAFMIADKQANRKRRLE